MNKMVVLFLTLILSVLSIMGIAVFGTAPESGSREPVRAILIDDYDDVNSAGDLFKDVRGVVDINNNLYTIHYTLDPIQAGANIRVSASPSSAVNVQIDPVEQTVYVFFNDPSREPMVTITLRDVRTENSVALTLWFKPSGHVDVPDLD